MPAVQTMPMDDVYVIVTPELDGMRADAVLAALMPEWSRSGVQKLLQQGAVTVSGKPVRKSDRLPAGTVLDLVLPEPSLPLAEPEDLPLDILYEDDDLLIVNKPQGMVVHPAPGHYSGTLVNALLYHCGTSLSGINGVLRPGILHRIDRDTSGLLAVAKNDPSHRALAAQLAEHHMDRIYEAVVRGTPDASGTVDAPVGRHPVDRKKMAVTTSGKPAVTHYELITAYSGWSHIRCRLETGRTHQIRVHMAHIGHPVAGDPVYAGSAKDPFRLNGQCLHAKTLCFDHPRTGEAMRFEAPLPPYFLHVLDLLQSKA